MPKKKSSSSSSSSLKKPSQGAEKKSTIQQTKPVQRPGKLGKEIDDIFGGRKKKKPELEVPETTKAELSKRMRKKRKRTELVDGFGNNPKTRPRKRTEDGFLVYTEQELGINKANSGGTYLCPFECQCCF